MIAKYASGRGKSQGRNGSRVQGSEFFGIRNKPHEHNPFRVKNRYDLF